MTLNQIFKITGVLTTRKLPVDIVELLEEEYYSESRDAYIKYGDMDLIHFIRALRKRTVKEWKPTMSDNFKKMVGGFKTL